MNKRLFTILLFMSLAFNVSFLSMFIVNRMHRPPMPPPMMEDDNPEHFKRRKLWDGLELSEEHRQKMHDMRSVLMPMIRDIRFQLFEERRIMGELLMAAEPDSIAIEEQLKKIAELQTELEREVTFHILSQREILPEEQQKKLMDNIIHKYHELNPAYGPGRKPHYNNKRKKPDHSDQKGDRR